MFESGGRIITFNNWFTRYHIKVNIFYFYFYTKYYWYYCWNSFLLEFNLYRSINILVKNQWTRFYFKKNNRIEKKYNQLVSTVPSLSDNKAPHKPITSWKVNYYRYSLMSKARAKVYSRGLSHLLIAESFSIKSVPFLSGPVCELYPKNNRNV